MVNVLPQVAKLKGIALDLLFPRFCVGCGKEGDFICRSCLQLLPHIIPPVCPRCGRPQVSDTLCPACSNWQADIDGFRSPFRFEGVIRQAIYEFKYRNLRALAEPLAQLLRDYLIAYPVPADILVPVPLHQKRLKERGYNQSARLASELGTLINLPVVADCLARRRHTTAQARTANVEERQRNVTGAFVCLDNRLQGRQVLLIDDVATSGATLNACSTAIKASGATQILGLTLAREI